MVRRLSEYQLEPPQSEEDLKPVDTFISEAYQVRIAGAASLLLSESSSSCLGWTPPQLWLYHKHHVTRCKSTFNPVYVLMCAA